MNKPIRVVLNADIRERALVDMIFTSVKATGKVPDELADLLTVRVVETETVEARIVDFV